MGTSVITRSAQRNPTSTTWPITAHFYLRKEWVRNQHQTSKVQGSSGIGAQPLHVLLEVVAPVSKAAVQMSSIWMSKPAHQDVEGYVKKDTSV